MKRKSLLTGLMLLFCVFLSAQSGTCGDNITWTLQGGTLTISGTGEMTDYYQYSNHVYAPWYSYNNYITSAVISDGVTNIGRYAFYNCNKLTSVEIPNSITSIGNSAFYGCSKLVSVTIPEKVTKIEMEAFEGCSSLTKVTLNSNTIVSKDHDWFSSNTRVIFGTQVKEYIIGNSVTSIGNHAFYANTSLTSVTIPNSITTIGDGAFRYCYSLKSVTIPNSVTSIGNYAFFECGSLSSFTIPQSVTSIGNNAFGDCNGLTAFIVAENHSAYCSIDGVLFSKDKTILVAFPGGKQSEYDIPNSVVSIGDYAFYDCFKLTSVTIPNSVKSIGKDAFSDCYNLKTVAIGDNVTSIGDYAFDNCSKLTSINIPNSVTNIGSYAFSDCSSLKTVIIESTVPSNVGSNAFSSTTPIYVPFGSLNAYMETDWKKYDLRVFDVTTTITAIGSTSMIITLSASLNGENKNKYIAACGVTDSEEFIGNVLEHTGLEPESEYSDMSLYIRTTKGDIQTVTASFATPALTLTTLAAKAVSDNTSILLAETNMSDSETSCGFEWRRNDQPEDMASNQVLCPVANGLMAGRLKGLKDDVYYKYRAFYKSAAGNMFYGDWQYVFTGDVTVEFDPVLYTYAAQFVSERKATLKGYALAGSDDFTEQGFEYWAESRRTDAPARRAPQYAIGEKHTVTGTGISMRVTLEDLDEGTVYKYRTYAKVGGKTLYGAEMTFTTQGTYEDPIETDLESVYNADADETDLTPSPHTPQARKYLRNGILYIEHNGITYTAQGHRID